MLHKCFNILCLTMGITFCGLAQQYQYQREFKPDSAGGWHKATLPPELIGKAAYNFSDLRIKAVKTNGDTLDAPYFVQSVSSKPSPVAIPFRLLNQSQKGGAFFYTFMLQQQATIQSIALEFGIENYDWQVTLEGSHNQTAWFTLLKDYRIVSIKNELTDYQFTQLAFAKADFTYYRLTVPATTNPDFKEAKLYMAAKDSTPYYAYPAIAATPPTTNQQKASTWIFDLPALVPVSQVQVFCSPAQAFIRPIEILVLDKNILPEKAQTYNYASLSNGTISSFDPTPFTFTTTTTQQIKLVVSNYDNAPIAIDSIRIAAPQRTIITQLPVAEKYLLWYGNKNASAPQYDIAAIFNNTKGILIKEAELREEQFVGTPPKPATQLWWEKPIFLYSLMGAIMLLLGYFTVTLMRKKQE